MKVANCECRVRFDDCKDKDADYLYRRFMHEKAFCQKAEGNTIGFNMSPDHFIVSKVLRSKPNSKFKYCFFLGYTDNFLDAVSVVLMGRMYKKYAGMVTVYYTQKEQGLFGKYIYRTVNDTLTWKSLPHEFWPTEEINTIINTDLTKKETENIPKEVEITMCLRHALREHAEVSTITGSDLLNEYEAKLKAISLTPTVSQGQFKNSESNDNIEESNSSTTCSCAEHKHTCTCGHCTCNNTQMNKGKNDEQHV